ncbi:sulfatase-like hydrolase/transferase [Akkermansiaceae bacterium]|nr:sulfatase-like hydrolase/transferase [bacterium]MDB4286587.1 sulfatase-like hydrolase/transferase [bacterium]MDB4615418.1 sulfatase-like hydrolase/transferase [Akkermansiaceae bacterium]MDB4667965.1 sulfatase-like hydrolase/transferase [Akkermansiaceae bacterium]MDC0265372.1 sulfatase-like hydrolase/transferase [bacterium]
MKRLSSILCLVIGLASAAEKPNIVLIITDDQSWDSLAFMGGKVHTPRIDRMAKEGLFFTDFNVTSTVCSPSRYSFLTGRYAGRCEGELFMKEHPPGDQTQVENIGELEPDRWNLAKVLQKNGYRTGFVGKSHVVRHDWLKNQKDSPLKSYPPRADPRDPVVNEKMRANHQAWCDEIKKYGFDFADGVYAANLKELGSEQLNIHNLDWTVAKAFDFLEDEESKKPFFLYFSTTLHHGPAPWVNKFSLTADARMTGEGFVKEGFEVMPARADVLKRNREAGFQDRDAYALWLDDGVGAILDKISSLGLEQDTLIMFVPDHGSYRHGKATLHDFGMKVPLLMQWKGKIKPGQKNDSLVANIDLAPTLFDLCGITPPEDYQIDGRSFKPALFGEEFEARKVLFGELGHSRCVKTKDWKYIAVRYPKEVQRRLDAGKQFKGFQEEDLARPYLTRNSHLGHFAAKVNPHYFDADQLYDLTSDPEEKQNVADNYLETVRQMQGHLSTELKKFPMRPFGEFTQ